MDWKIKYKNYLTKGGNVKRTVSDTIKTKIFIYRAKEVHKDTFDYCNTKFITGTKTCNIVCKVHGEFNQDRSDHLKGMGCRLCKSTSTTEDFIRKAIKIHGDKYSYVDATYVNSTSKIDIACQTHGSFNTTPNHHLAGTGCPKCSGQCHNTIYLLTDGRYYKIGMTTKGSLNRRVGQLSNSMGVKLVILASKIVQNPRKLESLIHAEYTINPYKDQVFDGYTEWRDLTPDSLKKIKEDYFS